MGNVDRLMYKYGGALAITAAGDNHPYYHIYVVPLLPVKQPPSSKKKYKRLPRLLVQECPLMMNPEMESLFPPDIFYFPYKSYTEEVNEVTGTYQIRGLRVKETFWDVFAQFNNVHIDAMVVDHIHPSLREINQFSWGFSLAEADYLKHFVQHSYERFFRAPLEVGHRVCFMPTRTAKTSYNLFFPLISKADDATVGSVESLHYDTVRVEDENTGHIEEFPLHDVR
jgi:hypothetical protein